MNPYNPNAPMMLPNSYGPQGGMYSMMPGMYQNPGTVVASAPPMRAMMPPMMTPSSPTGFMMLPAQLNTLYVGKIPPSVEDDFIKKLLEECGKIKNWRRVTDPVTSKLKGFGFCDYETPDAVLRALRCLSNFKIDDGELLLKVDEKTQKMLDEYVKSQRSNPNYKLEVLEEEDTKAKTRIKEHLEIRNRSSAFAVAMDKEMKYRNKFEDKSRRDENPEERERRLKIEKDREKEREARKKERDEREYREREVAWADRELQKQKERQKHLDLLKKQSTRLEMDMRYDDQERKKRTRDYYRRKREREREKEEDQFDRVQEQEETRLQQEHFERLFRQQQEQEEEQQKQMLLQQQYNMHTSRSAREKSNNNNREDDDYLQSQFEEAPMDAQSPIQFPGNHTSPKVVAGFQLSKEKKMALPSAFAANGAHDDEDSLYTKKKKKLAALDEAMNEEMLRKQKLDQLRSLIETIPTDKQSLFEFPIDWELIDQNQIVEKKVRPWITKKIIEYLGEEETTLIGFITNKVATHTVPDEVLSQVSMVLDEEAETFVLKMWRMLVFEMLAAKNNLQT